MGLSRTSSRAKPPSIEAAVVDNQSQIRKWRKFSQGVKNEPGKIGGSLSHMVFFEKCLVLDFFSLERYSAVVEAGSDPRVAVAHAGLLVKDRARPGSRATVAIGPIGPVVARFFLGSGQLCAADSLASQSMWPDWPDLMTYTSLAFY
jgi:hypothetical protein